MLLTISCASVSKSKQSGSLRPPSFAGRDQVAPILDCVGRASQRYGIPKELILGVIQVESAFQPEVISSAGARGLMQLMPRTAASLATKLGYESYDIYDPEFNISAGTFYLSLLIQKFGGDERLALAAYNTGPYRVSRWMAEGRPLPESSERYVSAVLNAREHFLGEPSDSLPTSSNLTASAIHEQTDTHLDQQGLLSLLREKNRLYGERPDAPVTFEDEVP